MDFDSRYTLLELFAETMSSEEHCMSFEGIHLPQVGAGPASPWAFRVRRGGSGEPELVSLFGTGGQLAVGS